MATTRSPKKAAAPVAASTSRQGQKPPRGIRVYDEVWDPAMAKVRADVDKQEPTTFTVVVPAGTKYLNDVLELALVAYTQAD